MKISYEFPVIYLDGDDPEHGEAKIVYEKACIRPLQLHRDPYEVLLEARGYSFHIIFGSQINGNFLCIPNWNVGGELAELWDRSWNMDSILRAGNQLDYEDATAITYALALLETSIHKGTSAGT